MNLKTSWDLTSLYLSDNDPRIQEDRDVITAKTKVFVTKWRDREDWLSKPAILREALDEYNEWIENYAGGGKEGYYFDLRFSLDQNDPEVKAKQNKAEEFSQEITASMQFFSLRLARVSAETREKFLKSPQLSEYRHYLSRLFDEAKYLLSEPEEKILLLKSGPSHSRWTEMVAGFIAKEERDVLNEKGKKEKKNFSEILGQLDDSNKKIRDSSAAAVNDIFYGNSSAAEHEMNAILLNKKIDDSIRGIDRPDITRHMSDDVDTDVVDVLVSTVESRFAIAQKFYTLKAKLHGVKQLAYHERNIPLNIPGKKDRKYNFSEGSELVMSTFKNLDPKFSGFFDLFLKNGQIDVYPQKGKRNGAFCAHYLKPYPTYILLNYDNALDDVLTLAHELGHGINNEMMREKQPGIYFSTPTSTAEVASTFMEDFVVERILKDADDNLRLSLMMKRLSDDVSTIFRQIAFYRFEQDLHASFREKGYLAKEDIGVLFQKHMKAYMGRSVEQSPGSENWWIYVNHFRYFFYVYSYASGLLISKSLQQSVRHDHVFIEKVKAFLAAGSSDSPKNIFMKMGVDIRDAAFWNNGLDGIETLLVETEGLAKKLKLI